MLYLKASGKQMFKMFFKLVSHENHKIVKKKNHKNNQPQPLKTVLHLRKR